MRLLPLLLGVHMQGMDVAPTPCPAPCANPSRCVVLDPGHPSEVNSGTQRVNGTTERDVNWRISQRLRDRLRAEGVEVLLTREDSARRMTNRERAEFANCASPALFLRLHADAGPVRGFAVFYADREGRAQGVSGPPAAVRRASRWWAEAIEREMRPVLAAVQLPARGLIGESQSAVGARQGALTGSIFAQVPTVLIEMVVLTDRTDAAFITSEIGQQAMVDAITRGITAAMRGKSGSETP